MVAVIAMLLDHIAYFFPEEASFTLIFHWIGRISAPLFIFCLVNGIKHTHSKKLYITRLYLASVIMAIFQTISQVELNFLRTLFITAILLSIIEKQENQNKYLLMFAVYQIVSGALCYCITAVSAASSESFCFYLLPTLLGSMITMEGGFIYVFLGLIFYWFSKNKKQLAIVYSIYVSFYTLLKATTVIPFLLFKIRTTVPVIGESISEAVDNFWDWIIGIGGYSVGGGHLLTVNYQWCMLFALPFVLGYNQKRGHDIKYFFYFFYPLHIILLWGLSR